MIKPMKKLDKSAQRAPEKDMKEDTSMVTPINPEDLANKYKTFAYVVGVAALLAFFYFWNQDRTTTEAENHMGIAMVDLRLNNLDKAEEKLNFIVANYSNQTAEKATYFLADIMLQKGMYDSAIEQFKGYKGSDDLLKAASYAGIALSYEKKADFTEAAKNYMSAAQSSEDVAKKAGYLFAAGVNYELAKDQSNAKSAFQSIVDEHTTFAKLDIVKMKLMNL